MEGLGYVMSLGFLLEPGSKHWFKYWYLLLLIVIDLRVETVQEQVEAHRYTVHISTLFCMVKSTLWF